MKPLLAVVLTALAVPTAAATPLTPPDFSGFWKRSYQISETFDPPPAGLQGPVVQDPRYPATNHDGVPRRPLSEAERAKVVQFTQNWVGDVNSPILTPKTRAALQAIDDQELAGVPHPENQTRCMMSGTPSVLNLFEGMKMLQTPDEVTILYERDHHVRHVYLNRAHSPDPGHSWWGESVGHYEGKTLVVDTFSENDQTQVDRFGTSHSDQIHVVERYTISDDRKTIDVLIMVEDPIAFTMPWWATAHYVPDKENFSEIVCAENLRGYWPGHPVSFPVADKPEF